MSRTRPVASRAGRPVTTKQAGLYCGMELVEKACGRGDTAAELQGAEGQGDDEERGSGERMEGGKRYRCQPVGCMDEEDWYAGAAKLLVQMSAGRRGGRSTSRRKGMGEEKERSEAQRRGGRGKGCEDGEEGRVGPRFGPPEDAVGRLMLVSRGRVVKSSQVAVGVRPNCP